MVFKPGDETVPIIVVEDLHSMRKAIRRTLEKEQGLLIEEFANAKDAIAYLEKNPVNLIISDIYMPNGDGFQLLRYVRGRAIANDVPVVFVSGEATKDDIVHSADLGVTEYILKPFEPAELVSKIKMVLEKYQNPTDRVQMLRTAESWLLMGDVEQAKSMFKDLIAVEPNSPRVLVGLAQVEFMQNETDAAIKLITQAIAANPMYFPAYSVGANIYIETSDTQNAIELLSKELSINGKQPERRVLLADLFCETQDYTRAIEQLRQALLDSPKDEKLLLKMAELQNHGGDAEKAIHYFLKTRRYNHHSTKALEGVANVALQMGKPVKALHAFADLMRLNPQQSDIYFARSRLYEKMEDYKNALADIDIFLGAQEDAVEGWQAKARLLGKLDRAKEAIEVWKKIVQLSPMAENFGKLALLFLKQGDYNRSVHYYEKAMELSPGNAKFCFNLASAYENAKSYDKAIHAYELFLRLVPDNSDAADALKRLRALARGSQQQNHPAAGHAPERPAEKNAAEHPRAALTRKRPLAG